MVEQVVVPTYAVLSATYKADELLKDICGHVFTVVIAHCFVYGLHHRKKTHQEGSGCSSLHNANEHHSYNIRVALLEPRGQVSY